MFSETHLKPVADRRSTPDLTPDQIAGESYVRTRMAELFEAFPALAMICLALNTVDQIRYQAQPIPIKLLDRPLPDLRRIVSLGKIALNSLDPEIVQDAVENVAHLLLADGDGLALFECQSQRIQSHYRRLAQSCLNTIQNTLERLS